MKNLKTFLLALILATPFAVNAQSTGDIKVTVVDENNEPMPGVVLVVIAGGPQVHGQSNVDGTFMFHAINAGTYDIQATMVGYKRYVKQGVVVNSSQVTYLNYAMQLNTLASVDIIEYVETSLVPPTYSTVSNLTADKVKHIATGRSDVTQMVLATCSSCGTGPTGQLVMRGSRETAVTTYVDGEKIYGSAGIPGGSIQQITILSGGIPAAYGDLTGGIIIISTKDFYSGMAIKANMYKDYQRKKEEEARALLKKAGKDPDTLIIEVLPDTVPAPAPRGN
jgi:hypothetical protein